MKITYIVIVAVLLSILLTATGFMLMVWSYHSGRFPRAGNELSWDFQYAGIVICNGPPWYLLNKFGINTPFDDLWDSTITTERRPDYWAFGSWHMWKAFFKFLIAWFAMIFVTTLVYQFSKLGVKKVWENIRPR